MRALLSNFLHVLRRFKTASVLNILGLSAALVVFLVCMIQVKYDLTFNHSIPNYKEKYQLIQKQHTAYGDIYGKSFGVEQINVLQNYPEIKAICFVYHTFTKQAFIINNERRKTIEIPLTEVGRGFVDLFSPLIIAGNVEAVLSDKNKVLISESTAKLLFGEENPIGRKFHVELEKLQGRGSYFQELEVIAVCKDFRDNTSVNNSVFRILSETDIRENTIFSLYVEIDKNNYESANNKIKSKEFTDNLTNWGITKNKIKGLADKTDVPQLIETLENSAVLEPISNINTRYPDILDKAKNMSGIIALLAIGIIAFVIALINFVNLTVAMAPARLKSFKIHLIIGASKNKLRSYVIFECVLFCTIAFILAFFALSVLGNSSIADLLDADLSIAENRDFIIYVYILVVFWAALTALYPAWFTTQLGSKDSKKAYSLQKVLTIFQYIAVFVLIIVTLFVKLQHSYVKNYNLGIDAENVVYIEAYKYDIASKDDLVKYIEPSSQVFTKEVMAHKAFSDFTSSSSLLGTYLVPRNTMFYFNGISYNYFNMSIEDNFTDFFSLKVLKGKGGLQKEEVVIFNKAFVDEYGYDNTYSFAQGKSFALVDNFHYAPLKHKIAPAMLSVRTRGYDSYLYFKIYGDQLTEGLKHLENVWKKNSKEDFKYHFLDSTLEAQYKGELNLSFLLSLFSIIVILIALMGVYGLITFNSKYRAKEIAIRKVQGSTVRQIMLMLNKGMLIQFVIAFFIACPLAYSIVVRWLEQFAYKTPIYWWVFLIAALIVLLITVLTVSVQSYKSAAENPIKALKNE